jgi:predicted TIM-barrel fold metal-dependent hydrolase
MDDNGVDYAVILTEIAPITTGIVTNEYVAEFCAKKPRLIPFACVNPYMVTHPAKELERLVKGLGMRGVKLYPTYNYFYPNESMLYPLYAKAQELRIPVMAHTGSSVFPGARLKYGDPLFWDDVCVDFPDLVVVMAHCGRGFWYDRAQFLMRLHKNLYGDVAGLPPQHLLKYMPELERISHKVLFGTDFPGVPQVKQNIDVIRTLPLSEEAKTRILGGNAARLLGIPED